MVIIHVLQQHSPGGSTNTVFTVFLDFEAIQHRGLLVESHTIFCPTVAELTKHLKPLSQRHIRGEIIAPKQLLLKIITRT